LEFAMRKSAAEKNRSSEKPQFTALNQTWSMDFVSDAIARQGAVPRRIKCLTVTDDFSHEFVGITADLGIFGDYITRLLD